MSYPAPILNLNFAADKQTGHPAVSYARASQGSYYASNGLLRYAASGVPRFDHDPLTGKCKGLLLEPAVTFLDTYSEQFDNAAWAKAKSSVSTNAAIAPDGTMTADKLIEDTQNGEHGVYTSSVSIPAGTNTFYIFAKPDTRKFAQLTIYNATDGNVGLSTFDLENCSVVSSSNGLAKIYRTSNGYCLCCITGTTTVASYAFCKICSSGTTTSYTGDGTSGFYIWGAKIYAGTGPTSYLPTSSVGVTRAADSCVADLTKLKDSAGNALWTGQEGTIVVDHEALNASVMQHIFSFMNGINYDEYILMRYTSPRAVEVAVDSTTSSQLNGFFAIGSDRAKSVLAFDRNGVSALCTGSTVFSAMYVPPILTKLYLGSLAGAYILNGHIRSVQLYNRRIADAYLPALSAL